jgi:hypothetical protein
MRLGSKLSFLVGLGAGYYLGTGAGPERREQLDRYLRKIEDNPQVARLTSTVRKNVHEVADAASDRVGRTVDAAGQKVAETVDAVGDKVEGVVSPEDTTTSTSGTSAYN